ncbi:MAG TPA: M48 family metallopeptidase [Opitutales bacterium]|jgi:STE24 endopeptidase|nr:M48 family metallopeptidase [Opitutales bacterium]
MTWTTVLTVFTALLALRVAADTWLDAQNRRHVLANAATPPEGVREVMDDATYRKSVEYTLAKNTFGQWQGWYDAAWLFIWLGAGLLPPVYHFLAGIFGPSLWGQAAVLCAVAIMLSLPGLPWSWRSQFHLEARFGFNKSTPQLWVTDLLKGAAVGLVLGYPLLCLVLWFFHWQPVWWWLWAWLALMVFQLVMVALAPRFIMPLFNKLTPMPEGELRERLLSLAGRTGFRCAAIDVIDGSKRSTHSNAFFTGFGRFRRIVFYDTLIAQLTPRELEAVLAHEIGHYRKGHVPKMLALSAFASLAGLWLVSWLAGQEWFYSGFRFNLTDGVPAALLLFALSADLVMFWLQPLGNIWSRRHEYEADAFARAALGESAPLVTALRKLHEKNLSNLTPHPLYSFFHYSHPTLIERESALRAPLLE